MKRTNGKDPAAVSLGKRGGRKGGPARMALLDAEGRRALGQKAAAARWKGHDRPGPPLPGEVAVEPAPPPPTPEPATPAPAREPVPASASPQARPAPLAPPMPQVSPEARRVELEASIALGEHKLEIFEQSARRTADATARGHYEASAARIRAQLEAMREELAELRGG